LPVVGGGSIPPTGFMRTIPEKLKNDMLSDPYYERCCLRYESACSQKIDLHHNLIHAGKQVNEKFAILPVCRKHHNALEGDTTLKRTCDEIMRKRATDKQIEKYGL